MSTQTPAPPTPDLLPWTSALSLGIDEVDEQHNYLVERINRLWRALLEHRDQEMVQDLIDDLHSYTQTHFTAEEVLMRSFGYPELEAHQRAHRRFVDQIRQAGVDYAAGRPIGMELLHFLNDWLQNHIRVTDREYARYIDRKQHGGLLGGFTALFRLFNAIGKEDAAARGADTGLRGLDMQKAIAVHVEWTRRLEALLNGSGPPISSEAAARDDLCMLGNWIATNAANGFQGLPELQQLSEDHRGFHLCAADIVRHHEAHDDQEARVLLKSNLRYFSNQIRLDIIQLYAAHHRRFGE